MKSRASRFFFCLVMVLFIYPYNINAQPGIKFGVVISGFQAWQDLKPYTGNDYRPFLGYEVDWVQDEGYPDIGFQFGLFYTSAFYI